jgi:hypothetical protein
MSTAIVFLKSESAFDTTWHVGLLYMTAIRKATSGKLLTKQAMTIKKTNYIQRVCTYLKLFLNAVTNGMEALVSE